MSSLRGPPFLIRGANAAVHPTWVTLLRCFLHFDGLSVAGDVLAVVAQDRGRGASVLSPSNFRLGVEVLEPASPVVYLSEEARLFQKAGLLRW